MPRHNGAAEQHKVIICITEGIPTKDMIIVKEYISNKDCTLVGPNCPGVITPDEAKCGIILGFVFKKEELVLYQSLVL